MTPPRLLICDGTNVIMRCAWGGSVAIPNAVPFAVGMIDRAVAHARADYLVVVLDAGESWRKRECPAYKAHRDERPVDTAAYSAALWAALVDRGTYTLAIDGEEADDVIDAVAARSTHVDVVILSGDSDLLACCRPGVTVLQPHDGGFTALDEVAACAKLQLPRVGVIADYKALHGEAGDFGPKKSNPLAVPGISKSVAARLLNRYGDLEGIIGAGIATNCSDRHAVKVAQHAEGVRTLRRLCTLRTATSVPPIQPSACAVRVATGAAA